MTETMSAWETEDEFARAAQASLPTPLDTPYRTPSRQSRRSTRKKSISPGPSSSPPLPSGEHNSRRDSKDITNDESISILDPRRFTPTLHANLVSEILTLRRDQDDKTKIIESLEGSLHSQRGELESVSATLASTAKEFRSLKRQLALLEGGTSSALGELARERDEAVENVSDVKRRLETANKKLRSQEEDVERVHELWGRDKDSWEDEKRKFERKIHVAEGRLKTVLEEVAACQAAHQNGQQNAEHDIEDGGAGHGSDTASIRSMSMTNSVRFSLLNGPNGFSGQKPNGLSLADELDLEEEDEEPQTDHDGRESVMSLARLHQRTASRESMISKTHIRNQSIDSLRRPGSVARGRILATQSILDKMQSGIIERDESAKVEYVEVGVQYSPPPSPQLKAIAAPEVSKVEKPLRSSGGSVGDWEIEANQRRKRVHASPPLIIEPVNGSLTTTEAQSLDDPLSPPRTPKSPTDLDARSEIPRLDMVSHSTQTEILGIELFSSIPLPPIPIPQISIHPPTSRPHTPREPLLPQQFKDVGCQVSMQSAVPTRSVSVQTEEIRVDKRINMLPKHLQPSTISSTPPSPEPRLPENKRFSPIPPGAVPQVASPSNNSYEVSGTPVSLPPRNPKRMKSQQSMATDVPSSPPLPLADPARETHDAYPGNNDDGPLSNGKGSLRRPHRSSSLFAGFDGVSSDEADDYGDADLSDSDFRTALSAPRPKSSLKALGKRISSAPTSVPEDVEPVEEKRYRSNGFVRDPLRQNEINDASGVYTLPDVPLMPGQKLPVKSLPRQMDKPLTTITNTLTAKPGVMRRAALIQNGIAAHQGRSRSPSLPEAIKEPPFPIPTRASSRKPPFSASAPSDDNRSPTREPWSRRSSGRGHFRLNSIRKVRSAAAIPSNAQRYRRHGSRSPPPLSASTEAPESPRLPPMPNNHITSPDLPRDDRFMSHRQQHSTNTAHTSNTGGAQSTSSTQATSVVDAIAQTMIGEWMFKYVRRRKSFGVSQTTGMDENGASGERHKRWVWLAPYERAVMWSSKQPISGSALMGKSGRKLVIQSVLDVKDDNPPPKGAGNIFNRSILILTPARALKFTASTKERHYVWLTALSFLAHSSQAVPELMAMSPPQNIPEFDIPRDTARLRKNPIRDSIRVAKGKTSTYGSITSGAPSVTSSNPGREFSMRTDASTRTGPRTGDLGGSIRDLGSYFVPPEAADPPVVPRYADRNYPGSHGRKRSNTGSRIPPPLSFRGFSERGPQPSGTSTFNSNGGSLSQAGSSSLGHGHTHAPSTAGMSVGTNGSSDIYNQSQQSSSLAGYPSGRSSIRTSDASGRPSAVIGNFFDAVGTVRMEAFISPMNLSRFDDYPDETEEAGMVSSKRRISRDMTARRRRSKSRDRRRSRNRNSYYSNKSREEAYGGSKTAGEEEYDPFRGF